MELVEIINKMKNKLHRITNGLETTGEKLRELQEKTMEIIQNEAET